MYGTPYYHAELRHETCEQLAAYPERYAGFVDTEKPFDAYVQSMRELGTYGGHLELSAFAHLIQKPIRIIQPGLVYVVSCDDDSPKSRQSRLKRERQRESELRSADAGASEDRAAAAASDRETRRRRREQHRLQEPAPPRGDARLETVGPLYIAYHDWEHYSSLRSLQGPHAGLPRIADTPPPAAAADAGGEDDAAPEPRSTEEKMVLMSTPGHTLQEIRPLLRELGDWESVVEELLRRDEGTEQAASASPPSEPRSGSGSPTSSSSTYTSASSLGSASNLAQSASSLTLESKEPSHAPETHRVHAENAAAKRPSPSISPTRRSARKGDHTRDAASGARPRARGARKVPEIPASTHSTRSKAAQRRAAKQQQRAARTPEKPGDAREPQLPNAVRELAI